MKRPGERETFGNAPLERATVKFGSEVEFKKSADSRANLLEPALKKDVYAVISDFVNECGPDFPGASLPQTQNVLRRLMKKHGAVQENEIQTFFEDNCVG